MKEYTKKAKEAVEAEVRGKFETAESLVFLDYRGLTVAEVTELRNRMRAAGVEYKVIKNTVIGRVSDELGYQDVAPMLEGPTAVAYSPSDPVTPAKILVEFVEGVKKTTIKGGVLDGKAINADMVKGLAKLPSKEELLAKMLGSLNAPITGFVVALSGILGNFVRVIDAIKEKKSA